jgi:hypothetical protein
MRLIILGILLISSSVFALNKSRKIETNNDEVSEVKTALGIATKVILPENPNLPPIIGDMGAFRVESIDKGYAIKPLRYGAKTNLFISTDSRSYSVKLLIVNQDSADYIVYLAPKEIKTKNQIVWRDFKRKAKSDAFSIETKRIGKSKDGFVVLEFSLTSKMKNFIEPEWFWLKQGKESKSIHSLIFSSREIDSDKPIVAALTLDRRDLSSELAAVIEIKYREGLRLEIPKEFLWRK